jgi:hypothetical protein
MLHSVILSSVVRIHRIIRLAQLHRWSNQPSVAGVPSRKLYDAYPLQETSDESRHKPGADVEESDGLGIERHSNHSVSLVVQLVHDPSDHLSRL